jgi:hypothetical protein
MILNVLIVICIAGFAGLAVLGHVLLLGDLWRFWAPARKPQEHTEATALRVPAE